MYKCVTIDYSPKTELMSKRIEEKSNEMFTEGYEFVSFSITNTAKAILVFKK